MIRTQTPLQLHCHSTLDHLSKTPTRYEAFIVTVVARIRKIEETTTEHVLVLEDETAASTFVAHLPLTLPSYIRCKPLKLEVPYCFVVRCRVSPKKLAVLSIERLHLVDDIHELKYHQICVARDQKQLGIPLIPTTATTKQQNETTWNWIGGLLQLLRETKTPEGLSVEQILVNINLLPRPNTVPPLTALEINQIIHQCDEVDGTIYATIDDQHFALTPD